MLKIYLKIYNNSKSGDNNNRRNYDFKILKFFNLNEAEKRENIIIVNKP